MKLPTNTLKYSLTAGLLISGLLFTGCSSKKSSVNPNEIDKIYKYSSNNKIKNSKAMHRATLRPYTVFGVRYYPQIASVGEDFKGIASWYGPNFHAKKTSNGETYNMYAMTAAHKTLPMNTMLRVLNLENGKEVIVRINDRGPFVAGRIIDLSNTAAHKIDMVRKGTVRVQITVLGYNGEIENGDAPIKELPVYTKPKVVNVGKKVQPIKAMEPIVIEEKVTVIDNYAIQIGAFSKLDGAKKVQSELSSRLGKEVVVRKIFTNSRYLYKVFVKGFASKPQAQMFKDSNNLENAIIVRKQK